MKLYFLIQLNPKRKKFQLIKKTNNFMNKCK